MVTRQNMPVHYSAEDYDRYTTDAVEPYDKGIMKRMQQEYRLMGRGPRTLLDIGTGTARLLVKIAEHPDFEQLTLIGTDFFQDMVEQAQATLSEHGLADRVSVEQCDVHQMPQADESADIIISRSTIHHWADPPQAFREIHRLLKRGGVAIIHEPRRDPNPEALAEFNRRRNEQSIEPVRSDEKYTPDEVGEFLDQAGLKRCSLILAPTRGPGSLGFEVRISKAGFWKRCLVSVLSKIGASPLRNPWGD